MERNEYIELEKEPRNIKVRIFTIGGREYGESNVFLLYVDDILKYSILIDCFKGCAKKIEEIIKNCGLKKSEEFKFNMICQTHPHKDHTTGIKSLIKKYSDKNTKIIIPEGIEYVLDSLAEEERAIYNYMVKIVKDNKTNYGIYESANNNKMLDCKTYKHKEDKSEVKINIMSLAPISRRILNIKNCNKSVINRLQKWFNKINKKKSKKSTTKEYLIKKKEHKGILLSIIDDIKKFADDFLKETNLDEGNNVSTVCTNKTANNSSVCINKIKDTFEYCINSIKCISKECIKEIEDNSPVFINEIKYDTQDCMSKIKNVSEDCINAIKDVSKDYIKGVKDNSKAYMNDIRGISKPSISDIRDAAKTCIDKIKGVSKDCIGDVLKIYIRGMDNDSKISVRDIKDASEAYISKIELVSRDCIKEIKDVSKSYIKEMRDDHKDYINEYSIVLEIAVNRYIFLFTGDVGNSTIRDILEIENRTQTPKFQLDNVIFVKIPHHGSSESIDLLKMYPDNDICKQKRICVTTTKSSSKLPKEDVIEQYKDKSYKVLATNTPNNKLKEEFGVIRTTFELPTELDIDKIIISTECEGNATEL